MKSLTLSTSISVKVRNNISTINPALRKFPPCIPSRQVMFALRELTGSLLALIEMVVYCCFCNEHFSFTMLHFIKVGSPRESRRGLGACRRDCREGRLCSQERGAFSDLVAVSNQKHTVGPFLKAKD